MNIPGPAGHFDDSRALTAWTVFVWVCRLSSDANGAEAVLDIPLSEEELAQLQRSANTMREMIDKLDG